MVKGGEGEGEENRDWLGEGVKKRQPREAVKKRNEEGERQREIERGSKGSKE